MSKSILALPRRVISLPDLKKYYSLNVCVRQDLSWEEAVNAAGPDTPEYFDVWKRKDGNQYPPEDGEVTKDILLVSDPHGCRWSEISAMAEALSLERTFPRDIFALAALYPRLPMKLKVNLLTLEKEPLRIVATTECSFEGLTCACDVWWDERGQGAGMQDTRDYGRPSHWFAFASSM